MRRPHWIDWVVYGSVAAVLVGACLHLREDAPAQSAERGDGPVLGPVTPFDPSITVYAPDIPFQPVSGTAFSISDTGLWLTARHVVEGCRQPAIVIGGARAVSADVRVSPRADIALLQTQGGPPALPLGLDRPLRAGQRAYHPGFPQGRPGEVASRLLGRETLHVRGRGRRDEPVLAWAEIGRTTGLRGTLSGLSGAPVLDDKGRVIAITLAEAPRRGRLYTTAPETLAPSVRGLQRRGEGRRRPVAADTYGRVAEDLRSGLQVAQVLCLSL